MNARARETFQPRGGRFFQGRANRADHRGNIDRLFEQTRRTRARREEKLVRPRGDNQNRDERPPLHNLLERVPPVEARHVQVEQNNIDPLRFEGAQRFFAVAGLFDEITFANQNFAQRFANGFVVIHKEHAIQRWATPIVHLSSNWFHSTTHSNRVKSLRTIGVLWGATFRAMQARAMREHALHGDDKFIEEKRLVQHRIENFRDARVEMM